MKTTGLYEKLLEIIANEDDPDIIAALIAYTCTLLYLREKEKKAQTAPPA